MAGALYLDASALTKLVLEEPQTESLAKEVERWDEWLSSDLVRAEVPRAVVRAATASALGKSEIEDVRRKANALVRRVSTFDVDQSALNTAATLEPVTIRTLDAIHLATILQLREEIDAVATYDTHMTAALRDARVKVIAPA
jgi:predicted nucleic acid-binding protein